MIAIQTKEKNTMSYTITDGLITGPQDGQCAGYILNFSGHGTFDPTGKITVGDLELTQAQVDTHNNILADYELKHIITQGKGVFYLTWDEPKCTLENPRYRQEQNGGWYNRNYRVSNWTGSFKTSASVNHGTSYGFGRFETRWVWFTGPDGKKWYGVQKGYGQNFTAKRLKNQR